MDRNISLAQVERAIALGCLRKYASLLNGTDGGAIVSFLYFRDLIEEAGDQEAAAGYWEYLKLQLKRLEEQWISMRKVADANFASAADAKKGETK